MRRCGRGGAGPVGAGGLGGVAAMRRGVALALGTGALVVPLVACGPPSPPGPETAGPADLAAEVEAWRERREASLRRPDGWLTLVGLFWLPEGASASFGTDPGNDWIVDGRGAGRIGTFARTGDRLSFRAAEGVEVLVDGEPVESLELVSDAEGEPTEVTHGSLLFYAIARGDRLGIRVKDTESPLLAGFEGIESFPLDPDFAVQARLVPHDPPRRIVVPDVLGDATPQPSPGVLRFVLAGETLELTPIGEPGEELFVVFGDATNGRETYGGGRFLYADPPGEDGVTLLDFNRAYNPPCVFTPYATCPLPPPENRLPVRVEAGEKVWGEH